MEERALIFILCMTCISQAVDYCPKNTSMWKEREASFRINCGRNKFYHCLRDENHGVEESCRERSWVQPGFCPEFNSVAGEIDVFLCKENMGKCPEATYWSNELYRYSACLKAVNGVQEQKASKENNITPGTIGKTNGGADVIIIISSSIVFVLIVAIVIIVVIKCRRRKTNSNTQKRKDDKEMDVRTDVTDSLMQNKETNGDQKIERKDLPFRERTAHRNSSKDALNMDLDRNIEKNRRKNGLKNARTLIKPDEIRSWIEQYLRDPGKRVILIVPFQKSVEIIEGELRSKRPGFLEIESFDDWSTMLGKEEYYVLLSCIMKELTYADDLEKYRNKLSQIASDIETLKLRAVIPIRSDKIGDNEHSLFSYDLFQNLDPIFELENTEAF